MRNDIAFEQQLIYTVEEVAQALKVNRATVYNLIKNGIMKSIKLGRVKITRDSLLAFIKEYDGCDMSDLKQIKSIFNYKYNKT